MNRIGAPIGCDGTRQGKPLAHDELNEGSCRATAGAHKRVTPRPRKAAELGHLPFLIKRDGTWLYHGTPINRKELVCLFASVLQREKDGSWWLHTPVERGQIDVEDAPFVAVELDWTGDGRHQTLSFRTNVDQVVTAGPEHPIRVSHDIITCDPTPYIQIRPGGGHLAVEARISRAVFYELVALSVPEWVGNRRMLGVWSQGRFFPLGEASSEEDGLDDTEFEEAFKGIKSDMSSGEA